MPSNSFANQLFASIERSRTLEQLLQEPLAWLAGHSNWSTVWVMTPTKGVWKKRIAVGKAIASAPDDALLGECLDTRRPQTSGAWSIHALAQWPTNASSASDSQSLHRGELILCFANPNAQGLESAAQESLKEQLGLLSQAIELWHQQLRKSRVVVRLSQILEVAANWHAHQDLDRLLQDIAQAATGLLRSDRASIFLWDKQSRELVGHPALGMEGKHLRIADDKGIAGAVLKSQQPRRWDRSDPTDEVDRRVDTSSGYRTDSLLAVPLIDLKGKPMGVFEVINHLDGRFDQQDEDELIELARHASASLSNTQTMQRLIQTRDRLTQDAVHQVQLIGSSQEMLNLKSTIARVGDTDLAVLLLGENGTGKEVVSRQIHYQSKRRYEPFIAVNCAAITETLLESELFGHEKGAFTDAHETRSGKFELASGGTLFLDEIGDMSLGGQAKLLRVLEEKVVVRVGGSTAIPVNVRVIAATNQNLVDLVRQKKFREDLYFRLTVVTLNLPPLRHRADDVLQLADFFLTTFCAKIGRSKPTLNASAKKRLTSHQWPGNVRELRNIIERIAYLTTNEVVEDSEIDFVRSPRADGDGDSERIDLSKPLAQATDDFQFRYIEQQLKASNRNMTLAAERMGMQRSNLYRKMKQLGMNHQETESPGNS
ncbi:MAG: sigma-54-dependent Fis family transcriptional regulator [Planctomycetota bacterium]|nr:sigma-54-dependent Fis family transcriptional regulator [Planctomycetota bacterium]